jgi:hypothetical protein
MNSRPVLFEYFNGTAEVLKAEYLRSGEQEADYNLGKNRENFCSRFLKRALPSRLKIGSGEIWDSHGRKTGQLDTIIVREDCPVLDFGTENVYLAEGVFAVIEVKSNLDRSKLIEAGTSLMKVRTLTIPPVYSIFISQSDEKPLDRPLRIIFAYDGATAKTVIDEIRQRNWDDLFDLVCVLNRGVLVSKGRLLDWTNKDENITFLKGSPCALGILYLYLVHYANQYLGRTISIKHYFSQIKDWIVSDPEPAAPPDRR